MIPAAKGGLSAALFHTYVRWKVRSTFRAVWVKGHAPAGDEPLLVYANHSSFWDGFIAHQLSAEWGRDGYCLAEEENLVRYPFLAKLGAFSVRRGEARSTSETVGYMRGLLKRPRAWVVVYPQGVLEGFGAPMRLQRGIEVVARRAGVRCQPMAVRVSFLEDEKPDVLVALGEPHPAEPIAQAQQRLEQLVEELSRTRDHAGFEPVVQGHRGARARWDALRGRGHG